MARSPFSDGHLDGFADATNGRSCDPRGRFIRWHGNAPESDWPEYKRGYNASYDQVCAADRAHRARRAGGVS